ncbi:MAG: DUF1292 domain-containing protein [Lachnospiraceae bacterium]|nr:DUF1292 domain-containing protein [Lachnospiraceae bacterium]
MEYEVVILELDDGTEAEFAILENFQVDGKKYVLLGLVKDDVVTDDEEDILFMRDETDDTCGAEEIILTMIETDEEYDHVVDEYVKSCQE